jgi:uncharacterized protein (TIGR02266 family)
MPLVDRAPRKAVNLLIRLTATSEAIFADRFATNISSGGMFIRSRELKPLGTSIQFRVELANGARALQGTATVAWVRSPGDPKGPPGMGLRFVNLDPASRSLVDRIVKGKELRSADPPEPAPAAAAPAAIPPPPPPEEPEEEQGIDHQQLVADVPAAAPEQAKPPAPRAPAAEVEIAIEPILPPKPAPPTRPFAVSSVPFDGLDLFDSELCADPLPQSPAPAPPPAAPAPPPAASALPSIRRERTAPTSPGAQAPVILAPARGSAKAELASVKRPVFLPVPTPIEGKGPIIGIDLGTTNSCVAAFSKGKPTVLKSREGYWTIPSVLSLTLQGKLLVGHRAKKQMILNPARTIYGAKRLVGRDFQGAIVKQVRSRFHYEIVADDEGRAAVKVGDKAFTLEEVQGLVLRECKEMAELALGVKVERAVVTCPAYYSEPQREAVRRASALAGLKVERILNEPTAAALAFGINKELSKKILVYDLGGGTFDATVLRIDSNVFEVLATGGDIFLGGTDFDNQVVDWLLDSLKDEGLDVKTDAVVLSRVTEAAEHAKVMLSERMSHEVHVPMLMLGRDGKPVDLRRTLTRAVLEQLVAELVDKTIEVVRDVLLDAKLTIKDIDEVILVGGQSRMPLVREKLNEAFKKPAHASVNADEAVALGAAICASTIDKVCSVVLIDVVPMTIGVGLQGGGFRRVIERNTTLPAQRSFSLPTVQDGQTTMELSLFQGEDPSIVGNEYLGTVRIEGIPPAPKGALKVAVTVQLDTECVLHVEALEMTTRKRIQATMATRYSPEELQKRFALSATNVAQAEARRGDELAKRAGRFWGFLKKVVGKS